MMHGGDELHYIPNRVKINEFHLFFRSDLCYDMAI